MFHVNCNHFCWVGLSFIRWTYIYCILTQERKLSMHEMALLEHITYYVRLSYKRLCVENELVHKTFQYIFRSNDLLNTYAGYWSPHFGNKY